MLKSQKSRELLLKYSGYIHDRKCLRNPKSLTPSELKQLQLLLKKEGALVLAQVISHLESEKRQRRAPQPYREFFYELSLNTPVCGILQIAGNEEAIKVVQLIASGIDICHIQYKYELKLQDSALVLAFFILKLPFSEPIPVNVCSLITDFCDLLLAPFQSSVSQLFHQTTYFPNLPTVRGTPAYLADQHTARHAQEVQDTCRKHSSTHPTFTPGIVPMEIRSNAIT